MILALILANAFFTRWCGLGFGLPYIYSDEPVFVVPSTRMLLSGDLNPHWFGHPGSFVMVLLAVFFGLLTLGIFVYLLITGQVHNFSEFRQWFTPELYRDTLRPCFYYSGRLLTVILSLVLIGLTYHLGKKLFGKPVGILAAFCLSIAPLNIALSRMIRTDIPGTVLILLTLWFLLRFIDAPQKRRTLVWAAVISGFAAATKYTIGAVFIPVFVCAVREDLRGRTGRNSAAVCASAFLAFFAAAPFIFLDWTHAVKDILYENSGDWLGMPKFSLWAKYAWYLSGPLRTGIGGLFFEATAIVGVFFIIRMPSLKNFIFFLFPLIYFFGIGLGNIRMPGWIGHMLPFEAIAFGCGFYGLHQYLAQRFKTARIRLVVTVCFAVVLLVQSLPVIFSNIRAGLDLMKTDSRTTAKNWIDENLPEGSKIAYEDYAPRMDTLPKRRFVLMDMGWSTIASKPVSYYEDQGVNFIVMTDSIKSRYLKDPRRYPLEFSRLNDLEKRADLIKVFTPETGASGPGRIEIFQLKKQNLSS